MRPFSPTAPYRHVTYAPTHRQVIMHGGGGGGGREGAAIDVAREVAFAAATDPHGGRGVRLRRHRSRGAQQPPAREPLRSTPL